MKRIRLSRMLAGGMVVRAPLELFVEGMGLKQFVVGMGSPSALRLQVHHPLMRVSSEQGHSDEIGVGGFIGHTSSTQERPVSSAVATTTRSSQGCNAQQIEWFKAGSALNIIRAQQKR